MKIPLGDQGYRVAQAGPQVQAPEGAFGGLQARALIQQGQQVSEIGQQIQQQQEQLDRAKAATSLANLNNDLTDIHDQVNRDVESGALSADDAAFTYTARAKEAKDSRLEGLSASARSAIDANFTGTNGRMLRSIEGTVLKRKQTDTMATLNAYGEAAQRRAVRDLPGAMADYDAMVDNVGPSAGLDSAQIGKAKQAFREGAVYNFGNNLLAGAAQTGNVEVVNKAIDWLQGPEAEPMDPTRRTALLTKAYGYKNGIQASNVRAQEKADREALARENAGTDAFNQAYDLWAQGRYFSTEYIGQVSTVVAGTSSEKLFQELVKSQAQMAGWSSMPLPKQQAELERMRAAGSTLGVGVSPIEQKTYEQLDKSYTASAAAYKANPWQAAQERGVIEDAPQINLATVQDAQQIITRRMAQIGQVEVAAGRRISPLQPEEAQQIGKLIRALPPDQQAGALASFGESLGNSDRVADLARQMAEKDKTIGLAMAYANSKTTSGRYTSELLLRGERALKDGTAKVDQAKETGWRAEIAKEVGDATLNQDVRQQWIDSAFLIQASFAADGDGVDIKRAVNLATGGLRQQRDGTKVPRPYGMSDDTFTQRIATIGASDLAAQAPGGNVFSGKTAIPLDRFIQQLPQSSLVHAGQGKYAIRAGQGFVTNSAGQRITIDLNPSRPVASPPNGAQGQPARSR